MHSHNSYVYIDIISYVHRLTVCLSDFLTGGDWTTANDQKLIGDMYLNQQYNIQLDYNTYIFQSMHETTTPPLPYCVPSQHIHIKNGIYINTLTHTSPAVIHFNGGGKVYHIKYESQAWYKHILKTSKNDLTNLAISALNLPYFKQKLRYSDICGVYLNKEYNYI